MAFCDVPQGTQGVIDELYWLGEHEGFMVAWDLPCQPLPKGYRAHDGSPAIRHGLLRDGFDCERELDYLEVVG